MLYLGTWLALWVVLVALVLYPVSTNMLRACVLLCLLGLWSGALFLFWRRRAVCYSCLALALIALALLSLPGRASDGATMRRAYVASLARYEGTRYVWGGENGYGIDCSGLVRRGLINADFRQGIATANPKLLREASSLWWHDASARSLLEGYRQKTREILSAPSINELDHSKILPGDIAVTADGLHTLAYVGDATWIEADPIPMRVVTVKAPSGVTWFKVPVHIMRWSQFEREG
ncbi:MAG: hypothetical protein QOF61_107 [Acidobacteriota bacterium]|jgi:hypothetical protein|nr:hypothetical protein [Acidobacteriota bacterium]